MSETFWMYICIAFVAYVCLGATIAGTYRDPAKARAFWRKTKCLMLQDSIYSTPLVVILYSTLIWFLLLPLIVAVVGVQRLFRPLERKVIEFEVEEPVIVLPEPKKVEDQKDVFVDYMLHSAREEIALLKEVTEANDRAYVDQKLKFLDIQFKMDLEFGGKKKS